MILGMKSAQNYNFALIEAIKQIDNPIIEKFDILYLTVGFGGLVAGICGVYLALVEYATKMFPKLNRFIAVAAIGFVIIGLSTDAQASKNATGMLTSVIPPAGLVACFVIPAVLLLIAKARGLVEKPQKTH